MAHPELHARLFQPVVDDVLNRLQAHVDMLGAAPDIPGVTAFSTLPPRTVEGGLREFVEKNTRDALDFFTAHLPSSIPPHAFDRVKDAVTEVVARGAVDLFNALLDVRTYTPPMAGD